MPKLTRFCLHLLLLGGMSASQQAAAQAPLDVVIAKVETKRLANQIEALGTLYANETAELTANLTETISRINFSDGQRVEAGDILVELTNREQQAQLEEARASLADSRRQRDRVRQLVDSNALPAQQLDERTREFDIARARLSAVEARLSDRVIRAPFDGVVGLRQVSVGTLLTPGTRVATLHDDSQMKLDFSVPELRMTQVGPGQQVTATSRAFAGREFTGEVAMLDNEVDPVTRSVRVRALVPNQDGLLRPGMLMSTRIESAPRQALVIPEEALLPQGSQQFVMLLVDKDDKQTGERREIKIGDRLPGLVEVVEGLEEGQVVITHGNFRLQPGQPVSVKGEQRSGDTAASVLANE